MVKKGQGILTIWEPKQFLTIYTSKVGYENLVVKCGGLYIAGSWIRKSLFKL